MSYSRSRGGGGPPVQTTRYPAPPSSHVYTPSYNVPSSSYSPRSRPREPVEVVYGGDGGYGGGGSSYHPVPPPSYHPRPGSAFGSVGRRWDDGSSGGSFKSSISTSGGGGGIGAQRNYHRPSIPIHLQQSTYGGRGSAMSHSYSEDAVRHARNPRLLREEEEFERLTGGGGGGGFGGYGGREMTEHEDTVDRRTRLRDGVPSMGTRAPEPSMPVRREGEGARGRDDYGGQRAGYIQETDILGDDSSSEGGAATGSHQQRPRFGDARKDGGPDDEYASSTEGEEEETDPEVLEIAEREQIVEKYDQGAEGAKVDAWENPDDLDIIKKTDRYGFVQKNGVRDGKEEETRKRIKKELEREGKWLNMLKEWELLKEERDVANDWAEQEAKEAERHKASRKKGHPRAVHPPKLFERVWKGIPEKLRAVAWPRLLRIDQYKNEKRANIYTELLLRARLVSKDIKQIDLDINRTYRDNMAFRRRYDVKQQSLLNVLAAYSMFNTEVGYCQGMSQIVALFLMYMDEETAFWCLHALMVNPHLTMHGFFVPGFPKLARFEDHFKVCLKKIKPKLYKHLEKEGIPHIYLTKWWFGCFLDRVPFPLALRLWDLFLIEGDVILTAMALNVFKMHEKTIRRTHMETFMEFVQTKIADDFGYSDDEVMYSLRELMDKLKSEGLLYAPAPSRSDLAEVPTKALGPVLARSVVDIRSDIAEIQSRCSRANSIAAGGRSPRPGRRTKQHSLSASTHNGEARASDSIPRLPAGHASTSTAGASSAPDGRPPVSPVHYRGDSRGGGGAEVRQREKDIREEQRSSGGSWRTAAEPVEIPIQRGSRQSASRRDEEATSTPPPLDPHWTGRGSGSPARAVNGNGSRKSTYDNVTPSDRGSSSGGGSVRGGGVGQIGGGAAEPRRANADEWTKNGASIRKIRDEKTGQVVSILRDPSDLDDRESYDAARGHRNGVSPYRNPSSSSYAAPESVGDSSRITRAANHVTYVTIDVEEHMHSVL